MKKHVSDPKLIEKMWNLTIKGIERQLDLNKAGKKKDPNPEFIKLAKLLSKHRLLSPNPGQPFALWSGGYDLSLYAQSLKYTTLEKTQAGKIFNTLLLYPEWGPLGPLWNSLSTAFAQAAGKDVHVFFRVQDPLSVLERQELVELEKSSPNFFFHPIINKGGGLDALDVQELTFVPSLEEDNPRIFLKNNLVRICQEAIRKDPALSVVYEKNLLAVKQMKLD